MSSVKPSFVENETIDSDNDEDEISQNDSAAKVLTDQSNVQLASSKHRKQASMSEADTMALLELGNENTHTSTKANTLGHMGARNSVTRASVKKSATTASASHASAKAMRLQTLSLNDLPSTAAHLSAANMAAQCDDSAITGTVFEHESLIMPYHADVPQTSDDLVPLDKVTFIFKKKLI